MQFAYLIKPVSTTLALATGLLVGCASSSTGASDPETMSVTGNAFYRERMLLPPDARFEAVLEDISLADAPAVVVGRAQIDGQTSPPFEFSIDYDPETIDPRGRYAVRATITVGGQLWFTSDTVHPVITGDHGKTVSILMRRVPTPAVRLRLPATFRGTLPCADCPGVSHHLDLWPDRVFHLRREWLERDFDRYDTGRWSYDVDRRELVLRGGAEMPLRFEIVGPLEIRQLDLEGRPIESDLDYSLRSNGTLTPTELAMSFGGELRYMADAAIFTECLTGRSYPVAFEDAWIDAERAYLAANTEPGGPLYTTFDGKLVDRPRMEGDGTEGTIVVTRFINVWPGQNCERARADATLLNTYWRIVRLDDQEVSAAGDRREPHVILRGPENRYSATVGCNSITGGYELDGQSLRLSPGPTTLMACPPPLDGLERLLVSALDRTRSYRITAQTLELFDAEGHSLALLEAVYL